MTVRAKVLFLLFLTTSSHALGQLEEIACPEECLLYSLVINNPMAIQTVTSQSRRWKVDYSWSLYDMTTSGSWGVEGDHLGANFCPEIKMAQREILVLAHRRQLQCRYAVHQPPLWAPHQGAPDGVFWRFSLSIDEPVVPKRMPGKLSASYAIEGSGEPEDGVQ